MALITIFLLDLNGSENTINCVDTLVRDSGDLLNIHILINGSDSYHRLKIKESLNNKKHVYIYESKVNLGFAGGMNHLFNLAMKKKRVADFILLLNNDASIDIDNIRKLSDVLNNKEDVGIVGPKILDSRKGQFIAEDGVKFYPWIMQHRPIDKGKIFNRDKVSAPREVLLVNGTCMMLRNKVFSELNGFDESYFAYFEDWDLCIRARERGYRIIHAPEPVVSHYGSATTGKHTLIYQFLMTRNRVLIAYKHLSLLIFVSIFLPYFVISKIFIKTFILLTGWHTQGIKGIYLAMIWLFLPDNYRLKIWPIKNSTNPS